MDRVVNTLYFCVEDHSFESRSDLLLENYLCSPRNDGYLVERNVKVIIMTSFAALCAVREGN